MNEKIILDSCSDMTLVNAARIAFDGAHVEISSEAAWRIETGRQRFESFMETKRGYVYGSTTAPGARAKVVLSEQQSMDQGGTLRNFVALQAGPGGAMLPTRCIRLAVFARLSNVLTGSGKLRASTARAVADLLESVPSVPMEAAACSGEVMPLTWLMAPLADLPLAIGEAMALINGSPFATAMACDVALTASRRLRLAERIFAVSIEAAACPAAHFDRRLGDGWRDPYYKESLNRLHALLKGSQRDPLGHQAPTSWRVLPNVLAYALQVVAEASRSGEIGLQSLKDNPSFVQSDLDPADDLVLSSGGYHDHRSAKAIDAVNSALVDLCVLASRQVSHFLDGAGLGLPPLLADPEDGVGTEYLAWSMTEPLASARRAAEATTLASSLQDPAGNQSDVTSLGFLAYAKHREVAHSFDACLATLAVTAVHALGMRAGSIPGETLVEFDRRIHDSVHSVGKAADIAGAPLRQVRELIRSCADDQPTAQFEETLAPPGLAI